MTQKAFSTVMDWSQRRSLEEEDVIFHSDRKQAPPRVTIGVPTYRRGDTIDRALNALAKQTYRDFVVIISDNAGQDPLTLAAVERVAEDLPEVYLIAQNDNIGALANIHKLLGLAETEFFMWLADDDEISAGYLAELIGLLDRHPISPSAMGKWKKMVSRDAGSFEPQLRSADSARFPRIAKYVIRGRDDTLFYGLHRTDILREGTFQGFAWPNATMLTNWCYIFLFDLIWKGPIVYSDQVAWISHNYTEKQYERSNAFTLSDRAKTLIRRLNVFWLYCSKTACRNPAMLLVVVPASIIGFASDLWLATGQFLRRSLTSRAQDGT